MIRLPNDAARRRQLAERRAEQSSRVRGILAFKTTYGRNGHATRNLVFRERPTVLPIYVDNRADLVEKRGRGFAIEYRPHQGAREISRRLSAA